MKRIAFYTHSGASTYRLAAWLMVSLFTALTARTLHADATPGDKAAAETLFDKGKTALDAFTVGAPTKLKSIEIWRLKPTNQGFFEARKNRVWEPKTE